VRIPNSAVGLWPRCKQLKENGAGRATRRRGEKMKRAAATACTNRSQCDFDIRSRVGGRVANNSKKHRVAQATRRRGEKVKRTAAPPRAQHSQCDFRIPSKQLNKPQPCSHAPGRKPSMCALTFDFPRLNPIVIPWRFGPHGNPHRYR